MKNKYRVIYFNLEANSREYTALDYFDFETLEDAKDSLDLLGLGIGMPIHSTAPLEPHSDPEALQVHKIEIWQLDEYGDPSELVKSYTE